LVTPGLGSESNTIIRTPSVAQRGQVLLQRPIASGRL
jgi:hypothetical protein